MLVVAFFDTQRMTPSTIRPTSTELVKNWRKLIFSKIGRPSAFGLTLASIGGRNAGKDDRSDMAGWEGPGKGRRFLAGGQTQGKPYL